MSRPRLTELREDVFALLDDRWRSATDFQWRLGLGGNDWYRIALVLERLVSDGYAELKPLRRRRVPGSGHGRRYRRRQDEGASS